MADPRARRALLILVVCAVGAVLAGVAFFAVDDGGDDAEAGTTSTTPAGDPVAVDRIDVGTCFNDAGDEGTQEYEAVAAVDCDERHDNEVFHLFDAPEGDFPGDEEIERAVNDACIPAFEEFVGRPYTDSVFEILTIPPSEASWEAGDREVVCALYDPSREELTGSMRGADR